MFSVVIFRARRVMITLGLIVAFLGNASASPNTITVQGGRPVDKAIQELEKRYGWRITYEDPPYSHYSDITDVTETPWPGAPLQSLSQLQAVQQSVQREPQAPHRGLVPKGGSLSLTLPPGDPDELGAVEALVKSYNASRGGNVFAVVRGTGLLHVVPRQMTGLSGILEPVKPILDTVITIEPKERTAAVTVQDPRPVAGFGWQITYEDPPYVYYGDITDVSDTDWPGVPVQSPAQLQSVQRGHRTFVPKGGSLSFTLPSANPDELGAVEALLKSYSESHRGFEFAVVQGVGPQRNELPMR